MNKKALELIPCCNRYGKEWGRPIDKDWAHKLGVIHPTVHVLVFNLEKELIIQLRKKPSKLIHFIGMYPLQVISIGANPRRMPLFVKPEKN